MSDYAQKDDAVAAQKIGLEEAQSKEGEEEGGAFCEFKGFERRQS